MNFDLQPTLSNELIRARPLHVDDFELLYSVSSDPLIWEQHPNKNRYQRTVFENFFKGAIESGGALLVFDQASGHAIGSSRYYDLLEGQSVAIGYTFIARAFWGGKFNPALKRLMLDHAFRSVNRVIFHVGIHNTRSRMAMQRLGGILIGEEAVAYYGEQSSINVIYKIDRNDWQSQASSPR